MDSCVSLDHPLTVDITPPSFPSTLQEKYYLWLLLLDGSLFTSCGFCFLHLSHRVEIISSMKISRLAVERCGKSLQDCMGDLVRPGVPPGRQKKLALPVRTLLPLVSLWSDNSGNYLNALFLQLVEYDLKLHVYA